MLAMTWCLANNPPQIPSKLAPLLKLLLPPPLGQGPPASVRCSPSGVFQLQAGKSLPCLVGRKVLGKEPESC